MNNKIKKQIFNSKGISHRTGDYPLFGGEEPSLYDGINMKYPFFYEQKEKLRQLDWASDDVDLTQTRMDLLRCDSNTRNIMLYNLAYQWSLDSVATSIPTLLAPFVSNWEYGHVLARIGENEMLHSETYSSIVRNCIPDPEEVFDLVYKHNEVLNRQYVFEKVLGDLKMAGIKYLSGEWDFDKCRPYILKGLVAIYSLERISFMSSFAATFALAEQEYFVGAARLVQKILMDETIHYGVQQFALKNVLLKQGEWKMTFFVHEQEINDIVDSIVQKEIVWNKYLFSDGRKMVGLNEALLNEFVKFNAQDVYESLNLKFDFQKIQKTPLVWFNENWLDINNHQTAPMETDATNYMVSAVSSDLDALDLDDMDL